MVMTEKFFFIIFCLNFDFRMIDVISKIIIIMLIIQNHSSDNAKKSLHSEKSF
jgi:hypothetical protein